MHEIRFITLNPGHFHAALVQKEMYPQVAPLAHVYAPLGGELIAHLQRIAGFNGRAHAPTRWELEVHAGPEPLERLLREKPGNVVILAGRNAAKIGAIQAALDAGLHVLADKPWIIAPEALPRLEESLASAARQGLIAYDVMTERHEITNILLRELIADEAVFGAAVAGSADEPGVLLESLHHIKKLVAGVPLRRPASFFDVHQHGEGLTDVGTHLVDLIPWLLFPEQPIAVADIELLKGRRWPTVVTRAEFRDVTGDSDFPRELHEQLDGERLPYFCNNEIEYRLRGSHVRLAARWDFESPAGGGDTHLMVFRGSRARLELRQGRAEKYQPEIYVHAARTHEVSSVRRALQERLAALQPRFPGVGCVDLETHLRLDVPAAFRVGHEAHFAAVTQQFLRYLTRQETLPAWEAPSMLAKYTVTTRGVELSRQAPQR
jgi:predicted dehydrogenase